VGLVAEVVGVTAAYALLATWLLAPLFSHPARDVLDPLGPNGVGMMGVPDVFLIMWLLSWDWHALTTAPLRLFDANAFHPARSVLATTEHMLGYVPLFGPIYAVSGNPVLANQLTMLLSIALCGTAMYLLLRHWGVGRAAAGFGGFVYALCPGRAYDANQPQMLAGQYLPIALLFLDRTLLRPAVAPALAAATFLLLQMLCSYYTAYAALIALVGYAMGIALAGRSEVGRRGVLLAFLSVATAVAAFSVVSVPYVQLKRSGVVRDAAGLYYASTDLWRSYLYPPAAVHRAGWWLRGHLLYVGIVPLALAGTALVSRPPARGARRWAATSCAGLALACYVMGLGPSVIIRGHVVPLPFQLAARLVPGFSSVRAPARLGLMAMAGLAGLAGLGLDRLLPRRTLRSAVAPLVLVVLVGLTAFEYDLFRPFYAVRPVPSGDAVPPIYRALAALPPGPALEVPPGGWLEIGVLASEAEHMYFSTFHWHPILNGYTGYYPPTYDVTMGIAHALPDPRATALLARTTGLRYVVLHRDRLRPEERAGWEASPGLRRVGAFGSDVLFTLSDEQSADLLERLLDQGPQFGTLLDTALLPLPESGRRSALAIAAVPPDIGRTPSVLDVVVTNRSDRPWPALAVGDTHLVTLGYRWQNAAGRTLRAVRTAARLPLDLGPEETVTVPMHVEVYVPPPARLVVALVQDGSWFPDALTIPLTAPR
jgi:hypothetical protein